MKTNLADLLTRICDSTTINELWEIWVDTMTQCYGFDRLFYGSTRFATEKALENRGDQLMLTNYCASYVQGFIESGFYLDAPMVHWAMRNTGAKSWSHISELAAAGKLTPQEMKVVEFNRSFGVIAGYTISFPTLSPRSRSAISLAVNQNQSQAEVDELWRKDGDEIILINKVANIKLLTLPHTTISGGKLTDRQREVLSWVSDGKTLQDIAAILDVKQQTVEKHLRLARENLCVETTAQAVLRLAQQNQIFVFENGT